MGFMFVIAIIIFAFLAGIMIGLAIYRNNLKKLQASERLLQDQVKEWENWLRSPYEEHR